LASHLQVPLPYLLYRVNARFQEEIRGLKDIQGALSPPLAQPAKDHDFPSGDKPLTVAGRIVGSSGLSSSRLGSPLGVRARLISLGNNSPRPKKATSSSTLTFQAPQRAIAFLRPESPSSSSGDSDSDELAIKEEEADRTAEEEDALSRKLVELQKMMTNEALGLVSGARLKSSKNKTTDRGTSTPLSIRSTTSSKIDTLSSRSASQSISGASSPQGSIGEIPSPPLESQSPIRKKALSSKSPSPAAVSSRSALAHAHRRYGPLVDRTADYGSSIGSEASSFSDLSGGYPINSFH
jgi:hypothetical protein